MCSMHQYMYFCPSDCPCLAWSPPLHSWYRNTGCPCVSQCVVYWVMPLLFLHLVLECVHAISTCIHVQMTNHVCLILLWIVIWKHAECPCVAVCVCVTVILLPWSHTLIKMCTCISTCIHVHLTYQMSASPHINSCIQKPGWPLCDTMVVCSNNPHF